MNQCRFLNVSNSYILLASSMNARVCAWVYLAYSFESSGKKERKSLRWWWSNWMFIIIMNQSINWKFTSSIEYETRENLKKKQTKNHQRTNTKSIDINIHWWPSLLLLKKTYYTFFSVVINDFCVYIIVIHKN